MAEDTFKSLLPHIQLEPSSAKLVTYSQEKLHTLGQVSLNVAHGDQEATRSSIQVWSECIRQELDIRNSAGLGIY